MQVREIKIRELLDFIKSEEYQKLDIKPITELRAVSQFHNPDAAPDDLALIYAVNNNELLGFAGLLPKKINGENTKVYSNTCWWANQQKGKGIAVPLFLQLLKRADNKLFLAESTPRAKTILEKTGLFGKINQHEGIRGFIRFYSASIIQKNYSDKKWLAIPFFFLDFILNVVFLPFKYFFLSKFKKGSFNIEEISEVDETLEKFIQEYSSRDFIQKTANHFNWFKNYPWLKLKGSKNSIQYPFTCVAEKFELGYFVLKQVNDIKAFVAISNHDNLAKIPFLFFDKKYLKEVVYSIMVLIIERQYDSVVIFQPEIVEFMEKNKMPFYFRKTEIKYSGTTKPIEDIFNQKPLMQDGDGDAVFI